MDVVQPWLGRAAQRLRTFELALGIVRHSEVEQSLAERVVCETRRHDPGKAELA